MKILTQVSVTKREQEIKLDEDDFDEKKRINLRKKLIQGGMEPEEADKDIETQLEWKRKRKEGGGRKKKRRKDSTTASSSGATPTLHESD